MGVFDKLKAYLAEDEEEDISEISMEQSSADMDEIIASLDEDVRAFDADESKDEDTEIEAAKIKNAETIKTDAKKSKAKKTKNAYDKNIEKDDTAFLNIDSGVMLELSGDNSKPEKKKGFSFKGLFGKKKKTEDGRSDAFDSKKESKQSEQRMSIRASEAKAVQDLCEQLVDVTSHMNEVSREYALVTKYLTDIQRIEELPVDMAKELIEIATKIQTLDRNREKYVQSKNLLPPDQYSVMATYEDEVVEAIKNLYEMEMRDGMLKNDMGYLEGEKEDLKYMRDEYSDSISKLRGIIITILIIFLVTNAMLVIYALSTKNNVTVFSLASGFVAVLAFTIAFVQYKGLRVEFRENEAKIKRAVSLQNKVKAKYINNVNTVDYIYSKYKVNSAKELEYRWIQYNTMVSDAEKYNKTNNNLKRFCDELVLRLNRIGVEDSDVWTKQISALVDRREMVEIKHGLNQRRQKLRENMVTCEKIMNNAITALKAAMLENPGLIEIIEKQLSPYGVRVE